MWDVQLPEDVAAFVEQLTNLGFVETERKTGPMDSGLTTLRSIGPP